MYTQTCKLFWISCLCAHIHTHARMHARTHTHVHARMHAHAHAHTRTHARTHARTHTYTHARMHAHTHTHTTNKHTRTRNVHILKLTWYSSRTHHNIICLYYSPLGYADNKLKFSVNRLKDSHESLNYTRSTVIILQSIRQRYSRTVQRRNIDNFKSLKSGQIAPIFGQLQSHMHAYYCHVINNSYLNSMPCI